MDNSELHIVDEFAELEHVIGPQRDSEGEAAVAGGAGQQERQALIGDAAGAHEHRPAPPEVGVVDGQPHPAGEPDVGAPEGVRPPHQRRQVRLQLQVVQRWPQVRFVHPRQRRLDPPRRRSRPTALRRDLPRRRYRRRCEDHVPEVPLRKRRPKPLPAVRGDVHLRRLVRREAARDARAPPHMGRQEGVSAVGSGTRRCLELEEAQLGLGELEDIDGGGGGGLDRVFRTRTVVALHVGGRMVLDVGKVRRRGVAREEDAPVHEGRNGHVEAAGDVGPGVDEVQAGEAVGDLVLHADT